MTQYVSVFDLFSIGIGPSSSHTVGPMRAALRFADEAALSGGLARAGTLRITLYGSLAATGRGHGTFAALLAGLEGHRPETVLPETVAAVQARVDAEGFVRIGTATLPFTSAQIECRPLTVLAGHSNGMVFGLLDDAGNAVLERTYYSVGGGFVLAEDELDAAPAEQHVPVVFASAAELLALCERYGEPLSGIVLRNELAMRDRGAVTRGLLRIRDTMFESARKAMARAGELPGGLRVQRRAAAWHERLLREDPERSPEFWQDWVNLIALAVNEENASGGRVVTAPTNGAAGVVPAVLHYALHYVPAIAEGGDDERNRATERFLLAAAAVGNLFKRNASISGAEVGCQGEIGSASAMAAAGLAEVLGGSPAQVENAAEIAMEHNLGLTCDPIGGLVQIPCIERNAIAASKAVNAARMALWGDGTHRVSLDDVILTMRETGRDMHTKYKETSMGGLAVNVVEC